MVEVFIGRYKLKPKINKINLNSDFLTDDGIINLFEQAKRYLESINNKICPRHDVKLCRYKLWKNQQSLMKFL